MRGFWKMTWVEMKLFLREPMASFFTLIFPLMLLMIFGSIWGNKPSYFYGGFGYIDIAVPMFTAMIIATSGFLTLSIQMAEYREAGILRRMKVTPIRPVMIMGAMVVVIFMMAVAGMLLLIIAGKLLYGLRFSGNVFHMILGFVLSSCSFFSLGFILASLMPTARTAQVTAMVLYYPMLFLSGAALPQEVLPETIQKIAQAFPLTHVVSLLRSLWIGNPWSASLTEVYILLGIMVLGLIVSSKTFRWE